MTPVSVAWSRSNCFQLSLPIIKFVSAALRVEPVTLIDHYTIYFVAARMGPPAVHWRTDRKSFKKAVRAALERQLSTK
jgi:hypothetical protein